MIGEGGDTCKSTSRSNLFATSVCLTTRDDWSSSRFEGEGELSSIEFRFELLTDDANWQGIFERIITKQFSERGSGIEQNYLDKSKHQ